MVKVLQINTTVNSGSTGRVAEGISDFLLSKGVESIVAFGRGTGNTNSNPIRIGNEWDIRLHGIKTILFDRHGFGSKSSTKKFIAEVERQMPDILHFHNIHGYYVHVGYLVDFVVKNSIPVVWTFHDSWPFTGHCTYFDNIQCERWKTGCYSCPKKNKYPSSWFIDNSKKNFEDKKKLFCSIPNLTIVTPSVWLSNLVKQSFLRNSNIRVIANGIDTKVFSPASLPFNGSENHKDLFGKRIILGVASIWDLRKGLNDFIELSKLINDNYRIVLIGLSKSQLSNLPKNIIGICRTESTSELAGWYRNSFVFVNPTWQDNFPTTNIESLACGTPVITYRTGGSPEAIDFETGIVVEKGDINGLQSAIYTYENYEREELSAKCRLRALQFYSKEDRFHDYYCLYKEILASNA